MSQIIGIDVGGSNTNAVLIRDGRIVTTAKYPTDHQNLLVSAQAVLEQLVRLLPQSPDNLELHLSTTLTTNAIVEGRGEPAAALLIPGPGVNPKELKFPFPTYSVSGSTDHRGRETAPLDLAELRKTLRSIEQNGARTLAVVGKFAVRNPRQELKAAELIEQEFPEFNPVVLGHRLSGRLNFPRRVTTALLNASVSRLQTEFAKMIQELAKGYGINGPIWLLKADGGTMRLQESYRRPIETVLSGPAASVMGALALGTPENRTTVTLDIGGTTTEIAVLVKGEPLSERDGATIGGYRTLVPALFSRSFGLGGDSRVYWEAGQLQIGPERLGPPIGLGGPALTPTDALIALGKVTFGDRERVWMELKRFGQAAGLRPEQLAEQIIATFCSKTAAAIQTVFDELNRRPVYTVSAVLTPAELKPEKLIGMGGPASYFIPKLGTELDLDYEVLPYAEAANAVGAAATHPTVAVNLHADTEIGKLVIPELDELVDLSKNRLFDLKQGRELARRRLAVYASQAGIDTEAAQLEITEEEVFNVVRGFYTAGKIFSLQAQIKPGVNRINPGNPQQKGGC
ncbi:MAG TPA: hydantoinase/oxoprolinase family protein [Bacillota bacterium]